MENELVSICILCYNHDKFIEKTIEGVIRQKVTFQIKIYINDDCSSDNSVDIIEKLVEKYPNQIVLLKNNNNMGQLAGVKRLFSQIKGKYVAFFDGDDYWIYDQKLQEQVDFLEKNTDYIASCHDALVISQDDHKNKNEIFQNQSRHFYKYLSQFTHYSSNEIPAYRILTGETYIQTATLIWRNCDLSFYLKTIKDVKFNLDWYLMVTLGAKGKINYINEPWAVYSNHADGRSKKIYYHTYLPDKIKLLKSLFKIEFYNKPYFRYHIYDVISKEFYSLIIGNSSKKKSGFFLAKNLFQYSRFNLLKVCSFVKYVIKYRNSIIVNSHKE